VDFSEPVNEYASGLEVLELLSKNWRSKLVMKGAVDDGLDDLVLPVIEITTGAVGDDVD
jgi:hypothetical protein